MSDFASVVDRTRRAFATVSRLEGALARDPGNRALQINLAAAAKRAQSSQSDLMSISEYQRVEVCNYRLATEEQPTFRVAAVSRSLIEYQNLFSQIYDALKNGPKGKAVFGRNEELESALELAYSYSGSLGIVLFVQSERNFFEGRLDDSIAKLFEVMNIASRADVRQVADELGNSVVKRLHDWSRANLDGGFSTDVQWSRSDGRKLGQFVERDRLGKIVDLIVATSDEKVSYPLLKGALVGGDIETNQFHLVVPGGESYRGRISLDFNRNTEITLGRSYTARLRQTTTTVYATNQDKVDFELLSLSNPADIAAIVERDDE
ncbi:hypothetical protein [Enterovirga rhinocerotis]|uniref:Uncharacterized protein n=1 Tax=Enterovirga rhinocerotis TaxID=1339210 RepID=A0A4R7C7W1_9HYPH|nr:hypothetical protein [Enterovirga rhinocerotis]TDR94518.1 hypothetical protein EV668_1806 [Enterovirga rhinocerotis]